MKNLFVPYELALKLKEKGFNESCFSWYLNKKLETKPNDIFYFTHSSRSHEGYKSVQKQEFISAPLYQQVIDWLESKNIHLSRIWYDDGVTSPRWSYHIEKQHIGSNFNKAIEEALKLIP